MNGTTTDERIEILNLLNDTFHSDMRTDIADGLTSAQKCIPSKYLYDAYGSYLFKKISELPEYYQTRTELSILKMAGQTIMEEFHEGDIIELGSGGNAKIRLLLDAVFSSGSADVRYVPVDVSESSVSDSAKELIDIYPDLKVTGMIADFTKHLGRIPAGREKLFVFFGSTIGNFTDSQRTTLLKNIAGLMEGKDRFLIGIDRVKPKEVLERAYNDRRGITAEFNKNILRVLNRELGADFNEDHFDHLAFYDECKEQIEMHLAANRPVSVRVHGAGLDISMREGETIHTEICRKFTRKTAEGMAEDAGLKITRWFSDPRGRFSLIETMK